MCWKLGHGDRDDSDEGPAEVCDISRRQESEAFVCVKREMANS